MTLTDLDFTILDDLEFESPCEVKDPPNDECPKAAEWIIVYRNHCAPGNGDSLICEDHRKYLMVERGTVLCGSCRKIVRFRPYLIRIERIAP